MVCLYSSLNGGTIIGGNSLKRPNDKNRRLCQKPGKGNEHGRRSFKDKPPRNTSRDLGDYYSSTGCFSLIAAATVDDDLVSALVFGLIKGGIGFCEHIVKAGVVKGNSTTDRDRELLTCGGPEF